MNETCVPYPRKGLYLLLTLPMIAVYVVIGVILWQASIWALVAYLALFVIVAVGQSFACVHWQCPYVGRFAPCVAGFCLPASQIARLFKPGSVSKRAYDIAVTVAFVALLGIIVLPIYFLYQLGLAYLFIYLGMVVVYAACFLWLICPKCAIRHVCPGGQASTKVRGMISRE